MYKFLLVRLAFRADELLVPTPCTTPIGMDTGSFTKDCCRIPSAMSKSNNRRKPTCTLWSTVLVLPNQPTVVWSIGVYTCCIHVFACLVWICVLCQCLLTKLLHQSSVESLLRVGWVDMVGGKCFKEVTWISWCGRSIIEPAEPFMREPFFCLRRSLHVLIVTHKHCSINHNLCVWYSIWEIASILEVDAMCCCENSPEMKVHF